MKAAARLGVLAVAVIALGAQRAQAQSPQDCFLGEVKMFAGNFAPLGYAMAQGQILSIAQNQALFAILGTTYGGDGQTTFALPDLRGRAPIGLGQGPGLSDYALGQQGGTETVTETVAQMAAHTHLMKASTAFATHIRPQGRILAKVEPNTGPNVYIDSISGDTTLAADALSSVGGSQPQNNLPPYLAMNDIICIEGTFPTR